MSLQQKSRQPGVEQKRKNRKQKGQSIIEVTFMLPWIFFIFAGVLDFGFYSYAAINTQNAARAAVMYTAGRGTPADQSGACTLVLQEISRVPLTTVPTSCDAAPLVVTATRIASGSSLDGDEVESSVSVTVTTLPMIPIPGLMGQLTITRTAQARIKVT